jgi:hypothetical protein
VIVRKDIIRSQEGIALTSQRNNIFVKSVIQGVKLAMAQGLIIALNVKRIAIKMNTECVNVMMTMYGTNLIRNVLKYLMIDALKRHIMMNMVDVGLVEEDVMFAGTMKTSTAMNAKINLDGKNLLLL